MDLKFLHPALAHERACDLGEAFSEQRIGEPPRDGFVAMFDVSPEDHAAANLRRAWWVAHYAGVPTRSHARGLALVRAVVFHPEEVALAFLQREFSSRDAASRRKSYLLANPVGSSADAARLERLRTATERRRR